MSYTVSQLEALITIMDEANAPHLFDINGEVYCFDFFYDEDFDMTFYEVYQVDTMAGLQSAELTDIVNYINDLSEE